MIVTYNWLKQYMDLSDVSPKQLADAITEGGLEVESMESMASADKLCIGKVLTCIPHPDSDHLHVCTVDVGTEIKQIVCGAPNVAAGQKVIVALPGCHLPGGEIKSGVIRGQASDGMLCALFELGVDKKSLTEKQLAGIEILPEDAEIGTTDVLAYLGIDDTIFDVSLTPNRADCYSIWALAKDVGAILNKKVTLPDCNYSAEIIPADFKVSSTTDKCPYFLGRAINHVVIKESPEWLKRSLNSAGIKSINNVVDISNYVMLETGQPLHFYNLAKIPAREITAVTGLEEVYQALDGNNYQVTKDDIMITTAGKAIGYAGIMGGEDSKIDEETTGIFIEAAHFNLVNIRYTSRRLDLQTEAATRFAKGIDPLAAETAVERSTKLLIELADASGIEEKVCYGDPEYQKADVIAKNSQINKLLGTHFTFDQIYSVYERLDFAPEKIDDDTILTHIPSYRTDIKLWQDLSEEVIRLLGYDNVEATLPLMPTTQGAFAENGEKKRTIKQMLNGFGLSEVLTYSLVSSAKNEEAVLPIEGQPVRIENAMSEDRRYYRTSLLSSLLDVVAYNQAHKNNEFGLFEISDVYSNEGKQESHLSIAISNTTTNSKWQKLIAKNDFYTLKGILLSVLDKLGYDENRIQFNPLTNTNNILHPNKTAEVTLDRKKIAVIGISHPLLNKKYDISEVVLAEINLTAIFGSKVGKVKFTTVNRYPGISYDLALIVKDEVSAKDIINTIKKAGTNLLKSVEIFDVYHGENIEKGYKSVAVNILYQSAEKTLTENDIITIHKQVLKQLSDKLDASLRD